MQLVTPDSQFVISGMRSVIPFGGDWVGSGQIKNFLQAYAAAAHLISVVERGDMNGGADSYVVFTTDNYKANIGKEGGVAFQIESTDLFIFDQACRIIRFVKFFDAYPAVYALSKNKEAYPEPHLKEPYSGLEEDAAIDRGEALVLVKSYYRLADTAPMRVQQLFTKNGAIVFPGPPSVIPFSGVWVNKLDELDDYIIRRKDFNATRLPVPWNGKDTMIIDRSKVVTFWIEKGQNTKTGTHYTANVAEVFEIVVNDKGVKLGRVTEYMDSTPIVKSLTEHKCQKTYNEYVTATKQADVKGVSHLLAKDATYYAPGDASKLNFVGRFKGQHKILDQLRLVKASLQNLETVSKPKVITPELMLSVTEETFNTASHQQWYHKSFGLDIVMFNDQCQIEFLGSFKNNHQPIKTVYESKQSYAEPFPIQGSAASSKVPMEDQVKDADATALVYEFYRRTRAGESVVDMLSPDLLAFIPGDPSIIPYAGAYKGPQQFDNYLKKKSKLVDVTRTPWAPIKEDRFTVLSDKGRVFAFWNETGILNQNKKLKYNEGVIEYFQLTQATVDGKVVPKIARMTQFADTSSSNDNFRQTQNRTITLSLLHFILIICGVFLAAALIATVLSCMLAKKPQQRYDDSVVPLVSNN